MLTLLFSLAFLTPSWAADPLLDLNAINPKVDPCDDFYQYACGNWLSTFTLPGDQTIYNRQTGALTNETTKNLNALLVSYAEGHTQVKAKYAQKLGNYYASCMDTVAIEKNTANFIRAEQAAIDSAQNLNDFTQTLASLQLQAVNVFFSFSASADLADSSIYTASIDQGGMSFGDKSYYFNTDAKSVDIRNRFLTHVAAIFVLAGESQNLADQDATRVLDFETKLAQNALATEDMSDATQLYHPKTLAELAALAPTVDWNLYLNSFGIAKPQKFNVSNPAFMTAFSALWAQTPLASLKAYAKWQMLHTYAPSLATAFVNENFNFWSKFLSGQQVQQERWKQCTEATKASLVEALGEAYVDSFADPQTIRSRAETMINQIKKAFADNLYKLSWLDDATRVAAIEKLGLVKDNVGFPAKWKNYDRLVLANDFASNLKAAAIFLTQENAALIGKSTDPKPWAMAVWEQDAFYDPSSNSINFPLGSLIAPIFDLNFSQGANFGSIGGGWMGHELTHGFDSDGRNFDGHGNLKNWWSSSTTQAFDASSQCLVDQANQYEMLPGLKVNGKQTITENIADQGGVKMGYIAFETATAGQADIPLGSYNERKQHWLAYAQSWCTQLTEAQLRKSIQVDVHPPAEYRVNGVVANRPEFARDFGCKAGARMAPVNRCGVW